MPRGLRNRALPGFSLLLIVACVLEVLLPLAPVVAEEPTPPKPKVMRADNDSVTLSWRAPSFSTRTARGEDGELRNVVEARGWPTSGVPGEPALPYAVAVAVAPATGEVELEIESSAPRRMSLSHPLKLERAPQLPESHRQSGVTAPGWEMTTEQANAPVTLEELGWLRGHRLVRLTFSPLSYDGGQGLEVVDRVEVHLTFTESPEKPPDVRPAAVMATEPGPFVSLLQEAVVNPEQVDDFAQQDAMLSGDVAPSSYAAEAAARYKVAVADEGLYELTYEMLQGAGVPLDQAPPDGFRLEHGGEEVAYQWEGDGDGAFEAGERIVFYARPTSSRWATHDIYWLSSEGTGTLMSARSGDPANGGQEGTLWAAIQEERNAGERNYLPEFRSERDGDHWYWDRLWREYAVGDGDYDKRFELGLLEPDPSSADGTLRVYVQGTTASEGLDPDHRMAVSLNGSALGETTWDGTTYHAATLAVSAGALTAGTNEIRLTLPGNGATSGIEAAWLDAIELRYGVSGVAGQATRLEGEPGQKTYAVGGLGSGAVRIYDVSNPHAPQMVTGATVEGDVARFADADADTATYYVAAEDQVQAPAWIEQAQELPAPSSPPDYLIISHSDFLAAVAPLADHRSALDGLSVHTVPVEAVYDAFGGGRIDPRAIRDYVAYAYDQWAPEYLLLVGDGTHDPLNNYGSPDHRQTYIPPYLGMYDPLWGEAPSDNRFATLDGPDDRLPELLVGRLPVNTPAEAETVVAKILAYEEAPPPGPWNKPLLFFADAFDGATNFHALSDEIYAHVLDLTLESHKPERVYYCEEDCQDGYELADEQSMREAVLSRLNRGALLATWTGHSSWQQWGAKRLFHLDDLANLSNGGALPIFLQMTCFTSYFSQPTGDTLDESLIRLPDGGAIATWGPTSLGLTAGHMGMHKAFADATLEGQSIRLGPATLTARMTLAEATASLWDTYILFGDPAMEVNVQVDAWQTVHLPLVGRSLTGDN